MELSCVFMYDNHRFAKVIGDRSKMLDYLIELHKDDRWHGMHGKWLSGDVDIAAENFMANPRVSASDNIKGITDNVNRVFDIAESMLEKEVFISWGLVGNEVYEGYCGAKDPIAVVKLDPNSSINSWKVFISDVDMGTKSSLKEAQDFCENCISAWNTKTKKSIDYITKLKEQARSFEYYYDYYVLDEVNEKPELNDVLKHLQDLATKVLQIPRN